MKINKYDLITKTLETFYISLRFVMKDMIILPGVNLKESLGFAMFITLISFASKVAGLPTFVDYRGGILATLLLLLITKIGRRNVIHEIFRGDVNDSLSPEEIERSTEKPVK